MFMGANIAGWHSPCVISVRRNTELIELDTGEHEMDAHGGIQIFTAIERRVWNRQASTAYAVPTD